MRFPQRFTEVSIFLLLFGSMVGQMLQAGEVAVAALHMCHLPVPPPALILTALTFTLALPWCFAKEMGQVRGRRPKPGCCPRLLWGHALG